ncbi:hypothetical protein GRI38_00685 [Altererythrobacter aurantiacus]|uniref:TolA-binding protein n=1 Tax=Parapontixanthobacter aurantiacus TaxID=1463599 RepID=A0A844ZFN2_9SPHN|nr:hypothetical protein [Parapontixanthobacter aurantiacus]MXO84549.1 hypothetical protein [Parapontixanthobacter aurantiacus]
MGLGQVLRATRLIAGSAVAGALLATSAPAMAQTDDARLRKIEQEIRALQRRVFPGGDGRFFEPEIAPGQPAPAEQNIARPSTSALTDVLARLDALERQLQRLTAQTETNDNVLRQLTDRVEMLEEANAPPPAPALPREGAIDTGMAPGSGNGAPAQVQGPSPERIAAVQAIVKPSTGDAGDDEYVYGYRLWEAGFFPEAQQQLTKFVQAHPNHSRATFGRNLLGRAYLDDNKPREAASWFVENYNENKQAARAADSLLYLAEAMIAIDDTERACIALAEFSETYPALAVGRLSDQYRASRAKVRCN